MKFLGPADKNEIYLGWLRAELPRKRRFLNPFEIKAIERGDLADANENAIRERVLYKRFWNRGLLEHLPPDLVWSEVVLEGDDRDRLYLIFVPDLFLQSGRTFRVADVPANPERPLSLQQDRFAPRYARFHRKILGMVASAWLETAGIAMIASRREGPYTIIDGTHRSVAHVMRHGSVSGIKGYLGLAADLSSYRWSIEWSGRADMMDAWSREIGSQLDPSTATLAEHSS